VPKLTDSVHRDIEQNSKATKHQLINRQQWKISTGEHELSMAFPTFMKKLLKVLLLFPLAIYQLSHYFPSIQMLQQKLKRTAKFIILASPQKSLSEAQQKQK
jgi:hypothetical protein